MLKLTDPRARRIVLIAALLLSAGGVANATVLRQMSIADLTQESNLVVVADVQSQRMEWVEGSHDIRTFTTLRLIDVIQTDGTEAAGQEIILEQLGGIVGDRAMMLPGNARLAVRERVVLFLVRGDNYYVHGMEQGKFSISNNTDGQWVVHRLRTAPQIAIDSNELIEPAELGDDPHNGITLDQLLVEINQSRVGGER